ncbi:MAG: phospho-sugar mutase [Clostridia bacterium]|nr:phospho-sugar mutase [Bacilli bacterium]MBR3511507.1 phospho-sugar mutase [Clostridia bacterium]
MSYKDTYLKWINEAKDAEIQKELRNMNEQEIEDSFYKDLSFGTGGLRGVIGAGSNRMNIYTVAKATQGLSNYLNLHYEKPSVVIGYDSRIKSDVFSNVVAEVFSSNKIKVYKWPRLLPVPTVSFATRYLKTSAGVMITASHNPSKYNGYKVYGNDGCQITTEVANEILNEIDKIDIFKDIKRNNNVEIEDIKEEVLTAYIEEVKKQSVLYGDEVDKNVAIVYSPLNGTGLEPVSRVLKESGYSNITIVEEQRNPDGNFPTCPYPNPEIKEALELGLEYCKKYNADLMLATDPDCDRVGIAVKDKYNEYKLLSGNEVGILLLDYICSQRTKHRKMPVNPIMIKTIVTMELGEKIAEYYGVQTLNVLTGFKFIGEQIGFLEKKGEEDRYIFGFEESYGYLSGSYVRDKDGVNGAYLIAEMFSFYKSKGISLLDRLNEIYELFGYAYNTLHSFVYEGASGFKKMQEIMSNIRNEKIKEINKVKVIKILDYKEGIEGLPRSDVLKYYLEDNSSIVIRPSGTEPKLKIYISTCLESKKKSVEANERIGVELKKYFE